MSKRTIKNAVILAAVAIVLVVTTVFVTTAYLTSSAVVANTFTVGKVGISMFETQTDEDGNAILGSDEQPITNNGKKTSRGNHYLLVPGSEYTKDPTIYVDDASTEAYLFIKVRNDIVAIEDDEKDTIAEQLEDNGWEIHHNTATDKVYYYADKTTRKAKAIGGRNTETVIPVFETFAIDPEADVSNYDAARVSIMAYAIHNAEDQFGEFGTTAAITAAWNEIVSAYPYVPEVSNNSSNSND